MWLKGTGQGSSPAASTAGFPTSLAAARSIITLGVSYAGEEPGPAGPGPVGEIARYARFADYHDVVGARLKSLTDWLNQLGGGQTRSLSYVDTGPLLERDLAQRAGLGFIGKHTNLISRKLGNWFFLAEIITTLELPPDAPEKNHCGSCRRCLDACPTGALIAPYQMDATRCISYLTIEHRGPIAAELMEGMGRQVFGCDICQDVCPWNSPRRTPLSADPELEARDELVNPALEWLAGLVEPELAEAEFERRFNGSPVRRAGFLGLGRNVAIAMGNSGLRRFAPRLKTWAEATDEGLRTAARWALERLGRSEH